METNWTKTVADTVRTLEVAAALKANAVYNPEGAAALAKLIKKMAKCLDEIK